MVSWHELQHMQKCVAETNAVVVDTVGCLEWQHMRGRDDQQFPVAVGSTKKQKTSRSKKPQIDHWLKSKFTNLSRHGDDKETTNRKRPLTTDTQAGKGKKGCHTDSSRNFSASGSRSNDATSWNKPSSASASSPQKHDTILPQRTSDAATRQRAKKKQRFGYRKRRMRANTKDVPQPPPDMPRGEIVGCIIPASMTMPPSTGRKSKLSDDVSRTIDLDGRPMWYKRLMNDDYLTGRRLGARLLDGRDDLWTLENADPSQWGNRRSTAHSSVGMALHNLLQDL